MSSSFAKDFDTLFEEILADWKNQYPGEDASKGSIVWLKAACLTAARWGIHKHQDYIAEQIFPDTADTDNLEHHAWVRGLSCKTNETDAELLARLLIDLRNPPAGGNKNDYENWAVDNFDNVSAAYCIPCGQGLGSVDLMIVADADLTGSEIPSSYSSLTGTTTSVATNKLIDSAADFTDTNSRVRIGDIVTNSDTSVTAIVEAVDDANNLSLDTDIFTAIGQGYSLKSLCVQVKEYIDDERPCEFTALRVLSPEIITQNVTATPSGGSYDKSQIAAAVTSWMNAMIPGQAFYRNRIVAISIQYGADDADVSTPATNPTITDYQMIRPGTVTIS